MGRQTARTWDCKVLQSKRLERSTGHSYTAPDRTSTSTLCSGPESIKYLETGLEIQRDEYM